MLLYHAEVASVYNNADDFDRENQTRILFNDSLLFFLLSDDIRLSWSIEYKYPSDYSAV